MSFALSVSDALQERVMEEAQRRHVPPQQLLDLAIVQGLETVETPRPRPALPPYDPAALIALLGSFEQDDDEAQARDYADLKVGLEAARPGQRRLFGEGYNP